MIYKELLKDLNSENKKIKESAFSELYEGLYGKLVNFAKYKFLKNDQQYAEDMVIDTLMTVNNKIHLYNDEYGKFISWIYTILKNNCLQKLKKMNIIFIDSNVNESSSTGLNKLSLDILVESNRTKNEKVDISASHLNMIYREYRNCLKKERLRVFELRLEQLNWSDIQDLMNMENFNKVNQIDIGLNEYKEIVKDNKTTETIYRGIEKYNINSVKILYTRAKDDVIKYIDWMNSDKKYTFKKFKRIFHDIETKVLKLRKNKKLTLEHLKQELVFDYEIKEFNNKILELGIDDNLCDEIILNDYYDEFSDFIKLYIKEISNYGNGEYITTNQAMKLFSDKELIKYYNENTSINTRINWAINRDNRKNTTKKSIDKLYPHLNNYNFQDFDYDYKGKYTEIK